MEPPTTEYEPRIDYAARRRDRASRRASERTVSVGGWPLYIAVGMAIVILFAAVFEMATTTGRVHPGVTVAGVDIGGMIPEKASAVLAEELPARAADAVTVSYGSETWTIEPEEIGLTFDFKAAVTDAMDVGRKGGIVSALSGRFSARFGGVIVSPYASADPDKLEEILETVASGVDVAPEDASVRIDGTTATVIPGKDGLALDRAKAGKLIVAAMLAEDKSVEAPVGSAPVAITDAEAESAKAVAEQMMSAPAVVTFEKKSWTFDESDVAKWIQFRRSDATDTAGSGESVQVTSQADGQDVDLVCYVSSKSARKRVMAKVGAKVGRPARDARFKTKSGSVTIIPSKNGIGPDMDTLASHLTAKLADENSDRTVELRTTITQPKITTQAARDMGIKDRISYYTTEYAASNKPRVNNIHQLGDGLDGTLIAPGATFSFNKAVGERTAEKGYQEAPAIVNGKLVPQLGGGICQVGTTVFNAVFDSGLPVVERRNHSFYISHYPKGRDATVSWGGPDFKFKNTTDDWILVSVSYTSSSITIALYGTDPDYDVDAEVGEWRNMRKFATEKIKDPKLEEGGRVVEDAGIEGRSITVKRIVSKNGKVVRTDSFVSVYKPKTEVVRVGTKQPKKAESAEPVEDTEP